MPGQCADLPTKAPELEEYKELLRHHAVVLREYAKWSLLRSYVFPNSRETHRRELIQQFFHLGRSVKLTDRDMVLMLYRGIFDESDHIAR